MIGYNMYCNAAALSAQTNIEFCDMQLEGNLLYIHPRSMSYVKTILFSIHNFKQDDKIRLI